MNKYLIITIMIIALITGFFLKSNLIGDDVDTKNLKKLTLKVAIPCIGHASLIEHYLNNLDGIEYIEYKPITTFVVYYDKNKTSEADILNLDIFKDYPATRIN